MPKTYPDIENAILALLRAAPMKQVEIVDRFPLNRYLEVGHAVRSLDAQGLVEREKCGATYMVRIREHEDTRDHAHQ